MVFKKAVWASIAALALFVGSASAQTTSGTISGRVVDATGLALPGVTVEVQGVDITQTYVTDADGKFRFLELAPGAYKVTATLQGFRTHGARTWCSVGKTVDLPVSCRVATEGNRSQSAARRQWSTPRRHGTATNFTADELTKIPTSRDPFALMRSVPGVLVDRVNIGGNETGQQSNFASKGTRPQDASWTLDGVEITDMAATGASPTYFNYDNFDEIQVSTAGNDIKSRTGGIGLNMVVKRGTNPFRGSVRGYFDNEAMESVERARRAARRPASRTRRPTTTSRSRTTASSSAARLSATRRGSTARTRCRTSGWSAAPARWSIARSSRTRT